MSTLNNLKIRSPSDEQNKTKKQLKIFPVQMLDILGQAQLQLLKELVKKCLICHAPKKVGSKDNF